jgi:hypothetical protein
MRLLRQPPQAFNPLRSQEFQEARTVMAREAAVMCGVTTSGVPNSPDIPVYPECFAAWKRIEAAFMDPSTTVVQAEALEAQRHE